MRFRLIGENHDINDALYENAVEPESKDYTNIVYINIDSDDIDTIEDLKDSCRDFNVTLEQLL